MTKLSLSALAAAGLLIGGLSATSASAADLGGNCCADLEERIAELEATTARKGNRKVSLTISGWVAEQVTYWDDGVESNTYVTGIGTTLASNVKFTGQAQIRPGLTAGYVLHLELFSEEPLAVNQNADDAASGGTNTLQSYWFMKSDTLGKVSIGKQSHASDNTAILVDGSGSLVPANWVIFDGAGFFLRNTAGAFITTGGANTVWGQTAFCGHINAGIAADCNGVPFDAVRYDSPTFAGFSVSASWGEDDFWDLAARYSGEFNGVKVAVAAAYSENKDESALGGVVQRDSEYFQIGAYVQHVPTGLFLYAAYGSEDNNNITAAGNLNDSDGDHWYVKAGLRQRWNDLGHTVLYGEYGNHDGMIGDAFVDVNGGTAGLDTEMTRWGLGIVQEIDAAAMSIWLKYRHHEADLTGLTCAPACAVGGATALEDIDFVIFGGLINF